MVQFLGFIDKVRLMWLLSKHCSWLHSYYAFYKFPFPVALTGLHCSSGSGFGHEQGN